MTVKEMLAILKKEKCGSTVKIDDGIDVLEIKNITSKGGVVTIHAIDDLDLDEEDEEDEEEDEEFDEE